MRVCILKIIKMWELLLLFVVSNVVVKMAESFAANNESRFRSPKTGEEESKLLLGSIPKSTAYKTKWVIKSNSPRK